jgi:hypothetical protein
MVDGEPGSNWVSSLGKKAGYLKNPISIQSKKGISTLFKGYT